MDMIKDIVAVKDVFTRVFGESSEKHVFFAPGRVNLIGEHIDYNGGHVFPCALTLGTYIAAAKRNDRMLRFYSDNFAADGVIESSIDCLANDPNDGWANYVKAVISAYIEKGYTIDAGLDIAVHGTIPAKSGLSSSASLEVASGTMLNFFFDLGVTQIENALICQYAENRFIGVNCGIMDQFSSAMGKRDHAIFLNTASLEYKYVPLCLDDKRLIIINTNKPHELASSAYNERRSQCEQALRELQTRVEADSLCELTPKEFDAVKDVLTADTILRRARHAVTEEARTKAAVGALSSGDLLCFGELMNSSHASLKNDFDVTCKELDVLAENAMLMTGVYGARMTGGGFGGCTVNIVDEYACDDFIKKLARIYTEQTGLIASFYTAAAGDGAAVIE